MENNTLKICVTGAAGSIAYSLIPLLASGLVFGSNKSIHLSLLDIKPQEQNLKGILLELEDGAYHNLTKAEYGFDPKVMFRDCDVIIFLGGASRQPGQDKRDWLNVNGRIFKEQGEALNEVGKPTCKCVVVANPCNTNCVVLQKYCPKIPIKNFSSLSRLDHNRAIGQLARKLDTELSTIQKVTIWGNHSSLQFPDLSQTEVDGNRINNLLSEDYIKNEFIELNQKRAMEVIQQRKKPTIMSAAQAICDHLHDWYFGTPEGDWVSMSVISDGSYGIPEGLVFSMPVKCKDFEYEIVKDLRLGDFAKEKLRLAADELAGEKEDVISEIEAEVIPL